MYNNNTVLLTHRIKIHTYQFIKLFMLHSYHNNISENLPIIDADFVENVSKTFCVRDNRGRPPRQQTRDRFIIPFQNFFEAHYRPTMPNLEAQMPYSHLGTIFRYCATQYVTNLENNIKAHFSSISKDILMLSSVKMIL